MTHPVDLFVGSRVRQARLARDMNPSTLAQHLGVSYRQMLKYEHGQNRISCAYIWEIAQLTQFPVTWFFNAEEAPPTELQAQSAALKTAFEALPTRELKEGFVRMIRLVAKSEEIPIDAGKTSG